LRSLPFQKELAIGNFPQRQQQSQSMRPFFFILHRNRCITHRVSFLGGNAPRHGRGDEGANGRYFLRAFRRIGRQGGPHRGVVVDVVAGLQSSGANARQIDGVVADAALLFQRRENGEDIG
jgi:hypothetical protein